MIPVARLRFGAWDVGAAPRSPAAVQVHTLHIVGLHLMIATAKCHLWADDGDSDGMFDEEMCEPKEFFAPAITLYACSLVRVRRGGGGRRVWTPGLGGQGGRRGRNGRRRRSRVGGLSGVFCCAFDGLREGGGSAPRSHWRRSGAEGILDEEA